MEINFGAQQGWQCPICKRVYSPTTMMCMYCGNTELATATSIRDVQPVVNKPIIIDGTPNNIMVNYCNKEQIYESDN